MTQATDASRARRAARSWRDVASGVKQASRDDHVSLLAAGIAFFMVLSTAPALAALVAIYGLFASPEDVTRQVDDLAGAVPEDARELLTDQLNQVVSTSATSLGLSAAIGIALALWGASAAMNHLLSALSSIHGRHEEQGAVARRARALALTLAAIVFVVVTIALLTFVPAWVEGVAGAGAGTAITILRWPLVAVLMALGLTTLYRVGPEQRIERRSWVSWGSAIATALWLGASLLFSWFVTHFGTYNQTYGSMAAVVILMLWFFITAACVLFGAELDAEKDLREPRSKAEDSKPVLVG